MLELSGDSWLDVVWIDESRFERWWYVTSTSAFKIASTIRRNNSKKAWGWRRDGRRHDPKDYRAGMKGGKFLSDTRTDVLSLCA